MSHERLLEFNEIYSSQKNELHKRMVSLIEEEFADFGLGQLDERVHAAMMRVRRDRHVPYDFFLKEAEPDEILEDIYSSRALIIDPDECREIVITKMVSRDIDLNQLSKEEIFRLVRFLGSQYMSTISTPLVVAISTQKVLPEPDRGVVTAEDFKALDIGAGLGYQAAILNAVGFQVDAVEIKPYLVDRARIIAEEQGYQGIQFLCADGRLGNPDGAPYDAIVVAAAVRGKEVVDRLTQQLKVGGKLVLPEVVNELGEEELVVSGERFCDMKDYQMLRLYERVSENQMLQSDISPVTFVDLQEWDSRLFEFVR